RETNQSMHYGGPEKAKSETLQQRAHHDPGEGACRYRERKGRRAEWDQPRASAYQQLARGQRSRRYRQRGQAPGQGLGSKHISGKQRVGSEKGNFSITRGAYAGAALAWKMADKDGMHSA